MTVCICSTTRRPRFGTAATEFALALPLLMTLMLGCVDFGRVGYYSIALANAAGAGGHSAATHHFTSYTRDDWEQDVRNAILDDFCSVPDFDEELLTVLVETTDEPDGSVRVTVEARYPFDTIVDWPGIPGHLELTRIVEFRQYR